MGAPAAVPRRAEGRRPARPEIVTGGGTGTHLLDLEEGPFTEIQPGSYLFMDKQYGAVELAPGGASVPHLAHRRDAGDQRQSSRTSSCSTPASRRWRPMPGRPWSARGASADATYQFMGDEHGGLRFAAGAARPEVGDLVTPRRAALRSDRQPARLVPRDAGRPAGRHLADRRARLLGAAAVLYSGERNDTRSSTWRVARMTALALALVSAAR